MAKRSSAENDRFITVMRTAIRDTTIVRPNSLFDQAAFGAGKHGHAPVLEDPTMAFSNTDRSYIISYTRGIKTFTNTFPYI